MSGRAKPALNKQIIDEAAEWFVELNAGAADAGVRQRFNAWLRVSPEHIRAYLRMLSVWEEGSKVTGEGNGDPAALISWARAGDSVVSLDAPRIGADRSRSAERMRRVGLFSIAATVAVAIFGAWFYDQQHSYVTGIGEQRLISLADGSKVELNSRSRLKVRFTAQHRDVELLEGQALFRIAHDPVRPFIVHSDQTRVRAVGTQFDVYRRADGTVVTVLEGRVAVVPPLVSAIENRNEVRPDLVQTRKVTSTKGEVLLNAGEQIMVPAAALQATLAPKRTDVAAATAWTQQRLVFSRTPLTEAAQQFNRYNTRQLIVEDAGLASFIVSGTFSSTDPTSFVRFLRKQPSIRVRESETEIRVGQTE